MKKSIFSFAIVAAGLLMASCGNKSTSEQGAEGSEQQTEQTAEGQAADKGAVAECDAFKLTMPAGWKFNDNVSSETVIHLDAPEFGQFESVHLNFNKEKTKATEMVDQYYNGNESTWKKADDVTIGNLTFKRLDAIDNADINCQLFAETNGGVLEVELSKNVPIDAPALKALIESIQYK